MWKWEFGFTLISFESQGIEHKHILKLLRDKNALISHEQLMDNWIKKDQIWGPYTHYREIINPI